MSQLERLADAIVEVGKQSGPVQQQIGRTQQAASRTVASVPNDEAGYARAIRTQLYAAIEALRDLEGALNAFDKQAGDFAKRLVNGSSQGSANRAAAMAGTQQSSDGSGDNPIPGTGTTSGREFLENTPENSWLKQEIARMPAQPGEYTATLHGNPDEVEIDGKPANAFDLADAIRADPNWNGRPVFLLSCQTGAKPDGIAQQLASLLKVAVRAPTGLASFSGQPPHPVTGTFVSTKFGRVILPTHHFKTFHP